MNHRIRLQRGFTLIELLIVIVILGLLLSLVAPTMFSKVSSSQRKTALAQMQKRRWVSVAGKAKPGALSTAIVAMMLSLEQSSTDTALLFGTVQ